MTQILDVSNFLVAGKGFIGFIVGFIYFGNKSKRRIVMKNFGNFIQGNGMMVVVCVLVMSGLFCTAFAESSAANRLEAGKSGPKVLTGLDVLEKESFERLKGKKVGLITNHSGLNYKGEQNIDLMIEAKINLVALFSPEHGIRGIADTKVESGKDSKTGLTIHSLYGKTHKPTDEMLEGIDTLVFDIQDIGARFYTYIGTMGGCMEVAAEKKIKVYVLDRPNPIQGNWFDGPIQDDDLVGKFTAFRHMPTAHGMTVGEMALYFNKYSGRMADKPGIGCDLEVVKMEGWDRAMYYDETGLPWVNPSPNMRSVDEELLYTMVALTEANHDISVGRGTDRPFEYLGAAWLDGKKLADELRSRNLPGIWVMHTTFVPSQTDITGRKNYKYPFVEEVCQGVRFVVSDRHAVSPVASGIHMVDALMKVGGERYSIERLRGLLGGQWVLDELKKGTAPDDIVKKWREQPEFKAFAKARASVLLY
jgi:uncharacterized protein YbbC (DUF1343 family)